tara:strand:+ start:923 stop:1633 length:711 start_codon:yes stop_codon:yes gene_type:complete
MAVLSVDRVYQTVLALANKEQRGYVTPQEFNLFANQAQNEIFEQYFYDLNQFLRAPVGNKTTSSDLRDIIEEKIALFRVTNQTIGTNALPSNVHKLEGLSARFGNDAGAVYYPAEEVSKKEYDAYEQTALTRPSFKRPIFYRYNNNFAISPPDVWGAFRIDYIQKPMPPKWTYVVVNQEALWNPSAADKRDFELHSSEEKNLVIKILQYAGVTLQDYNITQLAGQKEAGIIQQEKS